MDQLNILKECMADVKSGAYQTTKAAKLAANTLDIEAGANGIQQAEILVN